MYQFNVLKKLNTLYGLSFGKDKYYNQYLFPLKNQSDFLTLYDPLCYKPHRFIVFFIYRAVLYIIKWFYLLLKSHRTDISLSTFNNSKIDLVITHCIDESSPFIDRYFGSFLDKSSSNLYKLLIGHNITCKPKLKQNEIYLGNQVSCFDNLSILYTCIFNFFKSIFTFKIPFRDRCLIGLEFLSSRTRRSYVLENYIDQVVNQVEIEKLYLTIEGHSWERVVIRKIRSKYPQVKVIGYCHGVLLKDQDGFTKGNYYDGVPDVYWVVGRSSKQNLELSGVPGEAIKVVGRLSQPTAWGFDQFKLSPNLTSHGVWDTILLLSSGEYIEVNLFINLAIQIADIYPEKRIVFRPHPAILNTKWFLNSFKNKCLVYDNIFLSNSSLASDASRSSFAFYRGTTAILEAAKYGAIPVFAGATDENAISVLNLVDILPSKALVLKGNVFDIQVDQNFWKQIVLDCLDVYGSTVND